MPVWVINCKKPAKKDFTPISFVCVSYEDIQWIYIQSPNFERYGWLITEEILKQQQARIESFIFQTAEERYLDFTNVHSNLFSSLSFIPALTLSIGKDFQLWPQLFNIQIFKYYNLTEKRISLKV